MASAASHGLILVTGAAGFIGSNVARMLADQGAQVVACDWFGDGGKWTNLQGVLLHDVIRPEALMAWLRALPAPPRAIVHMGAISATTEADVDLIVERNIRATLDLWTYAADHAVRFIYASSAATYGDGAQGFVDDDSPEALARLRPLNAYGWSKHLVDRRIADDVHRGRPTPAGWAGLKFFNVYGPGEAHKGAMRSVAHQIYPAAARGDAVALFKSDNPAFADGGQLRDFIYVADGCAVIDRMLKADRLAGLYNVGTGAGAQLRRPRPRDVHCRRPTRRHPLPRHAAAAAGPLPILHPGRHDQAEGRRPGAPLPLAGGRRGRLCARRTGAGTRHRLKTGVSWISVRSGYRPNGRTLTPKRTPSTTVHDPSEKLATSAIGLSGRKGPPKRVRQHPELFP